MSALAEQDAAPEPEPDEALRLVQLHVQEAAQRHGDHMLYADDDASEADEDDKVHLCVAGATAATTVPEFYAFSPSVSSLGLPSQMLDVFDASRDLFVTEAAALLPSRSYAEQSR